jgi:hypothetical protein
MEKETRKRYAVKLDVYVYAKNDYMARRKAHELAEEIDTKHVNARANVTEIGEQPFASLSYRELDDKSRPSDKEKDEPLPF